jgi:hypothetical protein
MALRPIFRWIGYGAVLFASVLCTPHLSSPPAALPSSGWGVNTQFNLADDNPKALTQVLKELPPARITYLRQDINPTNAAWPQEARNLTRLHAAGFKVLGLVPYDFSLPPERKDDLRLLYAATKKLRHQAGTQIDCWENRNEPDLGFDPEPPDASSAEMKVIYLGLKDASPTPVPVLLPSLGLPPGPWFDRVARNGLLRYGDAFNLHYYSHARDFADDLRSVRTSERQAVHAGWLSQILPLWVTEIGFNDVPLNAPEDPAGRARQAPFFSSTAQTASEMNLAAYFPYALNENILKGFSLHDAAGEPYPAWNAFAQATRTEPLSTAPKWIDQEYQAPRLILQWLPNPAMATPYKVGGSYRFVSRTTPLTGQIRIYSFAAVRFQGTLHFTGPANFATEISLPDSERWTPLKPDLPGIPLTLHPLEMKTIRVRFQPPTSNYARGDFEAQFTDFPPENKTPSPLFFSIETRPQTSDFALASSSLTLPPKSDAAFAYQSLSDPSSDLVTAITPPWIGINGLEIAATRTPSTWSFQLNHPSLLPGNPPIAIAQIHGLPANGFIRLIAPQNFGDRLHIRVNLIDDAGQRFSLFENFGLDSSAPANQAWLRLADFHPYFWGRFVPGKNFNPASIRELQLRFYFKYLNEPWPIRVEIVAPKTS